MIALTLPCGNSFWASEATIGSSPPHNNEEMEMVVREWLGMQQPDFYCEGVFKLKPI
jgi:hypothetical protein